MPPASGPEETLKQSTAIRDYALGRFQRLAREKYDRGQAEHGGLITDRDLIHELEMEVIDQWFYVQGLRVKLGVKD